LSSGRSAIVAYTMPLWATLLSAAFLGERITAAKVLGLALGLGGLVFLIERESAALEHAPLGALLMLGAALAWAIGSVLIKRHHWSMSSFALTGWLLAVGGAPIVIGAGMVEGFVWNRPGVAPSAIGILGFVYSATVAMLFCHWGWIVLLQQLPASVASIAILFIPVVGVWSSALLLGEPVGAPEIIGLASIVAALAIVLGPRLPSRR
jgi:drug/metabolite transporter (DMT)-like permease